MPRRAKTTTTVVTSSFQGFDPPESNYFRLPNSWTDITAEIDNLAELKVVEYILRHTWGYQEYGLKKHITVDEFVQGRHHADGARMDKGTGLSERAVRYGLGNALRHGLIEEAVDSSDRGRVKKFYSLRMRSTPADHPTPRTNTAPMQSLRSGVQSLHPDLQSLPPRGAKSTPRTEKDNVERQLKENNSVVVRLEKLGVTHKTAKQMVSQHELGYLLEKLDLVQWLVETNSPLIGKNPAGYLRRAIEENYQPPPRYKGRAQREDELRQRQEVEAAAAAEMHAAEQAFAQARARTKKQLRQDYPAQPIAGTKLTTTTAWRRILKRLEREMTQANFQLYVKDSVLVAWDGSTALIAGRNGYQVETLSQRFNPLIQRELSTLLGMSVQCRYLALSGSGQKDGESESDEISASA